MPLSEHEQRQLEQIERALYAEDPKFADNVRRTDLKNHHLRRIRRAAIVLVVGLLILLAGVMANSSAFQVAIGGGGFLIMLAAGLVLGRAVQRLGSGEGSSRLSRRRTDRPRGDGGMFGRIEERWKRRWEDRDR